MKVSDLRVHHEPCGPVCGGRRDATVSDLVAALREEGVGEVAVSESGVPGLTAEHVVAVSEPGRYLVVRIDGEET